MFGCVWWILNVSSECVYYVGFRWPKPQFWVNFDIWGLLYRRPFTDEGQIWCARADARYTHQISSECVHCVGFRWPKTTILGKFWLFGARVPTLFYRWGPYVVCYSRPMVCAYMPNFVSIGLLCRPLLAKTPIFAVFWTSAFSVVANWQQSDKLITGVQLHTEP